MESILFIGGLSPGSIALIVVALLLFFGGKKIPELMKGLGKGIKEFKNAKEDIEKEIEDKDKK
ncbi:MAG: twin-arginine translocase TatA/TatE family subunit [Flavobacteriales bacterium]|jgi:sec-independent protein translocase protein TatA|nr:twin-arginine translocase TatA/TatE family subunit [Flavobacteriales bacterium]